MLKVLFICHGNICRSPMAEFMFKDMVKKNNLDVFVNSMATSYEEEGNSIHYGTIRIFNKYNIPYTNHLATRFEAKNYDEYDLILCMDENNIRNLNRICFDTKGKYKKIRYMLDNKDVADPWYTGDFEATYKDILEALEKLIKIIK